MARVNVSVSIFRLSQIRPPPQPIRSCCKIWCGNWGGVEGEKVLFTLHLTSCCSCIFDHVRHFRCNRQSRKPIRALQPPPGSKQMSLIFHRHFHSQFYVRNSRSICKFGFMHLVATNISVWLHVLIQESVHQIVLNWSQHNGVYYEGVSAFFTTTSTTTATPLFPNGKLPSSVWIWY